MSHLLHILVFKSLIKGILYKCIYYVFLLQIKYKGIVLKILKYLNMIVTHFTIITNVTAFPLKNHHNQLKVNYKHDTFIELFS